MAGPGAGFARITIECGSSRFTSEALIGKRATTAETLIGALPMLTKQLQASLERAKEREARG